MKRQYDQVEDFVQDPSFRQWIEGGHPERNAFWEEWLRRNPHQRPLVEEAQDLILSYAFRDDQLSEAEMYRLSRRLTETIQESRQPAQRSKASARWAVAASAGLVVLAGVIIFMLGRMPEELYRTAGGEQREIILPDSTRVVLNGNASLSLRSTWSLQEDREVWLTGEAFFEVNRIAAARSLKFIVHTANMDIEVLGTEFNVDARSPATTVVLQEGSVKLRLPDEHELFMKPGDMVTYSRHHQELRERKVDPVRYSAWRQDKLYFDHTRLAEVARIITDTYALRVTFSDDRLADLEVNGTLPAGNLDILLQALTATLDLRIEQTEQTITISKN